jgi:hypothetical protein
MIQLFAPLYQWLYSDLSLRTAGLLVGALLLLGHLFALVRGSQLFPFLQKAPRNKVLGVALLAVALVWAIMLMTNMHLGEFWKFKKAGMIVLPVFFYLVITYVDEFLTARALGILLILGACPFLDAAFLEAPASRILVPILAYGWILLGMFYVGKPYLMRDHVAWITASAERWRALCVGGIAYGLLLIGCALAFWK